MSAPNHKVVNLYDHQTNVYEGVRKAILDERGDLTEGEIIEELARAYPVFQVLTGETRTNGTPDPDDLPIMCALIEETAAQVGDPIFTREQLESLDANILRNMAKAATSDAVNGRSTRLEITAYFACPVPCDVDLDGA